MGIVYGMGIIAAWATNAILSAAKGQTIHFVLGLLPPYGVTRGVFIWFGWAG